MSVPGQSTVNRTSTVESALARNRLGVPAVVFFIMSAAAPLTVVAGVVTTGFAVTGVKGIPLAFVLVGIVLALFSIGYVAMARYVANAGAFYAYVANGLGRPAGVGAAWVALVAYNALQVGLYGAIGAASQPLLEQWFDLHVSWWVVALLAWALVGVLGVLRVDLNGRVLAFLLLAEITVIMVYNVADLAHPAGGHVALDGLSPGELFVPGVGAILVLAVLGFIGFEAAVVFSEESKDPKRTVPVATYASVGIIAGLYALSAWAMTVATGPDDVVGRAQTEQTEVVFNLARAHIGAAFVDIGHALFLTSILAAMISFHNTTARYTFALGRERVLPALLGRTSPRSGSPVVGSLVQTAVGFVVIVLYAVAGWDPLVQLFFWCGTGGGFGVLLLITATSVSVLTFFARNAHDERPWTSLVAPLLASVLLAVVVVLAVLNFADLFGVEPTSPLRWIVPGVYVAAAVAGIVWALVLRSGRPDVYASIGLGAKSAAAVGSGTGAFGSSPQSTLSVPYAAEEPR
jgi:amino acid transporter